MIGVDDNLDVPLTAHIFEQVHGTPPTTTRHVPGVLPLLDGLDVPLPWGAVVAASRSDDGSTSLYSMNHHAQGVATPSTAGAWADEPLTALKARPPGTRLVINRELPMDMGLLAGTETRHATALALQDLHGPPATPCSGLPTHPRHALLATPDGTKRLSWDLPGSGLRLLLIDLGARHPTVIPPADPDALERAAAALLAGCPADLGPLLTDAHGPGSPIHDDALEAALDAGALGGRTIGACIVALTPLAAVFPIRQQVSTRLTPTVQRPPRYLTV